MVVADVLVRRDRAKSEETKESGTANLTSQTMSLALWDTIISQGVLDRLAQVAGYELHIVRMEQHAKEELTIYLASRANSP